MLQGERKDENSHLWAYAPLEAVKAHMALTGYPRSLIKCVQGRVEETIPGNAPEKIAVLRLDTDWYESTAHELRHLYPRLARGGALIIDDYGFWQGARKAVDEFIRGLERPVVPTAIDETGIYWIKES